jgi:hypothetical protein
MRIILGGLVGGILWFIWGAVSHMATPLGEMGFSSLSAADEPAVTAALKAAVKEPGLYMIPGGDMGKMTDSQREEWTKKFQAGPSAIMVVRPQGADPMSPKTLGIEFASNVVASLLGCMMLALVGGRYPARVAALVLAGLMGWASTNVSYWNWYGFPTDFTVAAGIEEVVGWLIAGLAMAAIVKPSAGKSTAAAPAPSPAA